MALNVQRTIMRLMGAREQPVTVTGVQDVLPWYRRLQVSAPEFMAGFTPFPTAWVRLWVPSLEDPAALKQRGFTLVDPDPVAGTFSLEFVLHEPTGAAATWAAQARPGDTAEIAFTPAVLDPDPAIGQFVLVGDASAIAAINSLLDHLPATTATRVILADRHPDVTALLRPHAGTEVTVVDSGAEQLELLRGLDLDLADSYVWAAGERRDVAAIRTLLRGEWKLPKDRQHTQYYWIEGKPFG